MPHRFFVTGTDTGVGKTVVSALLCAALDAVYWKPIQTGSREDMDRETVTRLAQLPPERAIPEAYCFVPPVSPHLAARLAGVRIDFRKIPLPKVERRRALIVEGAGGALVPINEKQLTTDLIAHLKLPVVLVSRTTLGTINHTLLSIAALRHARLRVHGVIFSGKPNTENRKAIEHYGKVRILGTLPLLDPLNYKSLRKAFRAHFDRGAFLS